MLLCKDFRGIPSFLLLHIFMIVFIHTIIVLARKLSVFPFFSFAVSQRRWMSLLCCCCFSFWYHSGK